MRKISPSLVITIAALWAGSTHAAPDQTGHRFEKHLTDNDILTQLNHARQSVSLKTSELVVGAMGLIGVPYRRGGDSAETGFDCSGFVRSVYQQSIGLLLPRKAEEQASATQHISKNELRPGDLVFFNTMRRAFSHVGIYVGNGKFIHSPRPGAEVRIDSMALNYWQTRFDGARRVPAVASPEPYFATSLAALNDDAGPGTGLNLASTSATGAGAGVGSPALTRAGSDLGTQADASPRTSASTGSGARSAKAQKSKPAQTTKQESKKAGLKKTGLKTAAKKQAAKNSPTPKQQAKKRDAGKQTVAQRAPKSAQAKKRAKA